MQKAKGKRQKYVKRVGILSSFCILHFAFCILLTSPARAEWTLTTADSPAQSKLTLVEWHLKDTLAYTNESGKVSTVPSRQVITLESDRKAGISDAPWILTLRNGDILNGAPIGMHDQNLQFKVDDIGSIEIPLKVIATLQSADARKSTAPPAAATTPTPDDTLLLKNGDMVSGAFLSATADKISMQLETGPIAIDLARVTKLTIGGSIPPRTIPPLSACITFSNGSKLTTTTLHWTPEALNINDPADQECKIGADQIISIEILGGRVVSLGRLDPSEDRQVSLFSTAWPTQINRNVSGDLLKVAHQTFAHGLGVHTKSTLVYDLDGSFTTMTFRCGLDDSAIPTGEAKPSIVLDGKVLWTPKDSIMKAGEISDPITLNIAGGKKLELHANPGQKFDILGRFNWLDPRLVRP